jgi:hypothetical protein
MVIKAEQKAIRKQAVPAFALCLAVLAGRLFGS